MNTEWFKTPFQYITGVKALILGLMLIALTAFIASVSGTHFDGLIDIHYNDRPAPFTYFLSQGLIDWLLAILFFTVAGKIFAPGPFSFIDLAGNMALARAPMLIAALAGFLPMPSSVTESGEGITLAASFLSFLFVIWTILLMYRAFTAATKMTIPAAIWVFLLTLVVAELLSRYLYHSLFDRLSF